RQQVRIPFLHGRNDKVKRPSLRVVDGRLEILDRNLMYPQVNTVGPPPQAFSNDESESRTGFDDIRLQCWMLIRCNKAVTGYPPVTISSPGEDEVSLRNTKGKHLRGPIAPLPTVSTFGGIVAAWCLHDGLEVFGRVSGAGNLIAGSCRENLIS